jgi:hypothetical protein
VKLPPAPQWLLMGCGGYLAFIVAIEALVFMGQRGIDLASTCCTWVVVGLLVWFATRSGPAQTPGDKHPEKQR